jgi:vacuolar-type H+-ATPase subunit C/Vma6
VEYLLKTDYGLDISKIPNELINSSKLISIFYSILMSRVYHLAKIAPSNIREFLVSYADRYEVVNIKRILRSKRTSSQIAMDMLIPIPREYALINFQAMINASTLRDALELLKATRYSKIIEKVSTYQRYEVLPVLEALIDKIYYDQLRINLAEIPDRKSVEAIIGTEIDLRNIGIITDLKLRDISPDVVLEVSLKPFRLRDEDINQIARAKVNTISDIVAKTPYQKFALRLRHAIEEKKMEQIEQIISDEIYSKAKSVVRERPNSFTYVLGYLIEAEIENRNLISLCTGKELGMEAEKIKSLLYL